MVQLHGSWVAMPTPFTEDDRIDFKGFETLIDRQIKYGTSQILFLVQQERLPCLHWKRKKPLYMK